MLPKFSASEHPVPPRITKTCGGRDVSALGAFPVGAQLVIEASVPRTLAVSAVVLRLRRDTLARGEENLDPSAHDYPFSFVRTDGVTDVYRLDFDTAASSQDGKPALFYYEYIFLRGMDTLFSDSEDNVRFGLSSVSARQFRLLTYDPSFAVPAWVGGGVMYHVFVDRFCRGSGETSLREDAVLHSDWKNGEPQYAEIRGGEVRNNDFFGGNLWGVAEKLPYLHALGVSIIYLSPVFDSPSNHKYDTADYTHVDPGFGGDEALAHLLAEAHALGMRVVLDGVFNHTGSDSLYFDAENRRGNCAMRADAPYRKWYYFKDGEGKPDEYECWWGIRILPKLNLSEPSCREYFTAPGGIIDRWTAAGVDGWRLDVADELPDEFLEALRRTAHRRREGTFIVGEVWENAADKIAYGRRRKYFRGAQIDSVMNYPLRTALMDYARTGSSATLAATLTELWSSYPPAVCGALMNVIGTHDTERILTFLGDPAGTDALRAEGRNAILSAARLTAEQRERGIKLLRVISALQFTVFGFPCVYYGDETGAEGLGDPFCRRPMQWERAESDADGLVAHYRALGAVRRRSAAFDNGDFVLTRAEGGYIEFTRQSGREKVTVAANLGPEPVTLKRREPGEDLYRGRTVRGNVPVPPLGFVIIGEKELWDC